MQRHHDGITPALRVTTTPPELSRPAGRPQKFAGKSVHDRSTIICHRSVNDTARQLAEKDCLHVRMTRRKVLRCRRLAP